MKLIENIDVDQKHDFITRRCGVGSFDDVLSFVELFGLFFCNNKS
jgi:hypothetical protein